MSTKRAYKLQEFVAHASTVNCLKIGRKSSRVLATGGEDHKVNLWSIGKPNAILSLSGHSSGIDSVSFDSSEVLVAAGAASGTIKLWDLEEAKIVRTFTGHRSNCISLDFHPFGEFFASGSSDTNLKIWDIRRKGCIHTYKGHTRGVNAIRFTPDGRWVVSGGEDNTVKLWDLTAGKLLHDFKCHEGQIQCIDFHPHEFLLATGSADKTVRFWDLETFELIGTAGPESAGVRCMTFNPDGKTLLCGLHESLKVFSWEPIRCHDSVDVSWSRLSDLNVHEGKLLGCSCNQSCVGVWVVDISCIEPYAIRAPSNGLSESKPGLSANVLVQADNIAKISLGRLSTSHGNNHVEKETKSVWVPVPINPPPVNKDPKVLSSVSSVPSTPQRMNLSTSPKSGTATAASSAITQKRNSAKMQTVISSPNYSRSDVVPVIVPRNDVRTELAAEPKREVFPRRSIPLQLQPKSNGFRRLSNAGSESEGPTISIQLEPVATQALQESGLAVKSVTPAVRNPLNSTFVAERSIKDDRPIGSLKREISSVPEARPSYHNESYQVRHKTAKDSLVEVPRAGRTHSLVSDWEKRERSPNNEGPTTSNAASGMDLRPVSVKSKYRGYTSSSIKEACSASDEDVMADILEKHDEFVSSLQSRCFKLQIIHRYWDKNDIKGAISAMEKMADHGVIADVISFLTEKTDAVTLDICTVILPLLASLLESDKDRHLAVSLDMLVKLVRVFGSVIYSALSAPSLVGVDIEAETRLERCNLCYVELEKVKRCLPLLMRRGGSVAKSAQELNLALNASQE
ncbi:Katanin p80 WD40 repeat-containing subunit B1 homolog KTN80.3-like protein [Drosera capensis]